MPQNYFRKTFEKVYFGLYNSLPIVDTVNSESHLTFLGDGKMSDCPQISNERWTLGELGYLDTPISKHYEFVLKKEREIAAKERTDHEEWHRKNYPSQYTANGVRIKNW